MLWIVSSAVRESADQQHSEVVTVWTGPIQASDARLKQNVENLPYGLSELLNLRPVTYQWKDFPSQPKIGFIAQEVEPVIPEVVYLDPEDPESTEPRYYGINYGELAPLLVRSIQEQQATIEALEARLEMMEVPSTQ
jgi:hypothetical protein